MMAIIAAILFGFALIFELADIGFGEVITAGTFTAAGLLCVALHLAGVPASTSSWRGRRLWRRR